MEVRRSESNRDFGGGDTLVNRIASHINVLVPCTGHLMLSAQRLEELIGRFPAARIAVLGDFFLDRYLDINPAWEEFSVETGLPAHQIAAIRCCPGAAGTVVSNLAALGVGALQAIGFTGDDGESFELRRGLQHLGCATDHLHTATDRFTPTYTKPRDMTRPGLSGERSRLDTKNRQTTPRQTQQAVIDSLLAIVPHVDAVIILDQVEAADCGVVTKEVREQIAAIAPQHPNVTFWADSRRHIYHFHNVIIKPNEFEAIGQADPQPGDDVRMSELRAAVEDLRRKTAAPVFTTRGARGMVVTDPEWTEVPGMTLSGETDATGAGDSATAGCVLALCAGATYVEAAVVGNLVASLTVEQLATTGTARVEELLPRLNQWQEQQL